MRFSFLRGVRLAVLLAVAAVVAVPIAVAGAVTEVTPLAPAPSAESGQIVNETPNLWFVELSGKPTAEGGSASALKSEKQAFRDAAKSAGVKYTERLSFDTLWNGLSVRTGAASIGKLSQLEGVKAVYPVATVRVPQISQVSPDLATAIQMTGADIVQNTLGYTGAGVKVAVMDTGIDLDHPDLGGDGTPGAPFTNSRVVAQHDFVGDAFNANPAAPAYNPTPVPDPFADDCEGHGTHVSGIVGANGEVTGVAPGVSFGAYRVFGCEGSTTSDIMIAAMERALADGMDVLNMSIGAAFQTWPRYPTAAAATALVNKGVSVVTSIGNSGANGIYSASAPGVGEKVIGTASFDNVAQSFRVFTVSPDDTAIGYLQAAGSPLAPTSGTDDMARTGTQTTTNDACSTLPAGSLTGFVALVRRGTCAFYIKALNAQNAGAQGVVIYNNVPAHLGSITVDPNAPGNPGGPPITIPVVSISGTQGNLIDSRLASGPVTMTWTNEFMRVANSTGNLMSSFSSYGLAADLNVKPDIGAPGGFILSTVPLEEGGHASNSGTSMASPHVAGAVALLLQAKPHTSQQEIRDILQNSADPRPWWGNPGLGFLDNVHRQGAGMLDIDDAILATTKVTPGKLALGESQAGPQTRTLTLTNTEPSAVTYDLAHTGALATGPNTFTPAFFASFASVTFSAPSVTVPAGGSATVEVTVTAPAGLADKGVYGGYIAFVPQGDGQAYRVPYAGFKGDYQSIQVLTPTANNFPWLAQATSCTRFMENECAGGGSFAKREAGAVFTMAGALSMPFFLAHFDHQSENLTIEVKEPATGKSWKRAFETEHLPRNSTSGGIFAFAFDGTTTSGKKTTTVPDGTYVLEVTLQKALGGDADVETWTSPSFVIDRP